MSRSVATTNIAVTVKFFTFLRIIIPNDKNLYSFKLPILHMNNLGLYLLVKKLQTVTSIMFFHLKHIYFLHKKVENEKHSIVESIQSYDYLDEVHINFHQPMHPSPKNHKGT